MNKVLPILVYLFSFLPKERLNDAKVVAVGKQPEISVDTKGTMRLVYGRNDSIFYGTISPEGNVPSNPVFVAHVPAMHLGMTRGPQLASSAHFSMITAMDKEGNI